MNIPKNTQIIRLDHGDDQVLKHLIQLYQYDFSEIDGGVTNEDGLYCYFNFDQFWKLEGAAAYLLKFENLWAGFVTVRKGSILPSSPKAMIIDEFFIMRKYRRSGLGTCLAHSIFDQYRGRWEVSETKNNIDAQKFWRKVIRDYTINNYEEIQSENKHWTGPIQRFINE